MNRKDILETARSCVCGQRDAEYGSPEDNFQLVARLWSIWLDTEVSSQDVAMLMILLKAARIRTGTATEDSFVDIAGYAACGGEIAETSEGGEADG